MKIEIIMLLYYLKSFKKCRTHCLEKTWYKLYIYVLNMLYFKIRKEF